VAVSNGNVGELFDQLLAANPQAAESIYGVNGEYEALRLQFGVTVPQENRPGPPVSRLDVRISCCGVVVTEPVLHSGVDEPREDAADAGLGRPERDFLERLRPIVRRRN